MVSVSYLQKIVFSRLSLAEKINIKSNGRPMPDLKIVQASSSRKSIYQRKFNSEIYFKHDWLCGCDVRNALFCFPCLLYRGDSAWTKKGVKDLGHLSVKLKKHESCEKHIRNVIDLAMLGEVNIDTQSSEGYRLSIVKHNEDVRRNREILSKIIDCIRFCGQFELPLWCPDETLESANPGVFQGLLEFAGKLDGNLKAHCETASVFRGNSKAVQNELLDCILKVCQTEIIDEISRSKFLAVIADDTTDVSEKTQEVIVFRYENEGEVYERFWGFYDPQSQDAKGLSQYILEQLGVVLKDNFDKLIAQSYDGATKISGEKSGLQSIIKETYSNAHFIHCYAHQMNLIMEKAASENSQVRIFFSNLHAIPTFFSQSPQHLFMLDLVCKRSPQECNTKWNFNSKVINTVYESISELKECFEELQKSKNVSTVQAASGLLRMLKDKDFLFWLSFFHRIMPHVDLLCDQLQSQNANSSTVLLALENFHHSISCIRNQITLSPLETSGESPDVKRQKRNEDLTIMAQEVCDIMCFQAKERFKFTGHLSASKLLASKQFSNFRKEFPLKELNETVLAYPILKQEKLRTELSVIYERKDFSKISGALNLYQLIISSGLQNSLGEVSCLLKIVVTIPMTTLEPERCFSTLKRVKTFLRNTTPEGHLSALAMLSAGKSLIDKIENFNEKVIDVFTF